KMTTDVESTGASVKQFAEEIGVSVERLLGQFTDAGIKRITSADDRVSQEQKQQLLRYLQQHHGAKQDAVPEKIVLRRVKKTSEIKVSGTHGSSSKTVSIQVRKKRTFVKRQADEVTAPVETPEEIKSVPPVEVVPAEE